MLARNLLNSKLQIASAVKKQTLRSRKFSSAVDEVYYPKNGNANLPGGFDQYKKMYAESISDPATFWGKLAKGLDWEKPFTDVMHGDLINGDPAWFLRGQINASVNCIDRHLVKKGNQAAIIWEGDDPSQSRTITYYELFREVCRLANALKEMGIKKGDVVTIYMPMVPEAVYAMLACARIGAVHSVVFAGFSAESLRDRINDNQSRLVITADATLRAGKVVPLKQTVDEALLGAPSVKKVLVHRHSNYRVPMGPGRDLFLSEVVAKQRPYCDPEPMNSEDPLFILYTSGSTGRPKGLVHSTAGYLLGTSVAHKYIFDYREGDVHGCLADIGWITGHSFIVYGPLVNGATTVMFEGVPTYPNPSRYWDMVQRHKFNTLYSSPTAIRTLMKHGDDPVKNYDRSSLRVLGSVGEPINPEAWRWYYKVVGEERCSLVDTYWQTETGSIIVSPIAGISPMKPGSASLPFFGIDLKVFDPQGQVQSPTNSEGVLAVSKSFPAIARTILNDHERYMTTYLKPYAGHYFTGDGCKLDQDGFVFITGRVDDVIHKSGHRLGTAEIESALLLHPATAESAVIGVPDEVKGNLIWAFVTLKEGYKTNIHTMVELKSEVRKHIGSLAVPDIVILTPGLPKTRSGKIMRRVLRKIAMNETEQLGDLSTLNDPEIVNILIKNVKEQKTQQAK